MRKRETIARLTTLAAAPTASTTTRVSRSGYIMCSEGDKVIRVSKNHVCDMWEMANPYRYLVGRIT